MLEGSLRVNEVTTLLVEKVQDLKSSLLVAFPHSLLPSITEVHSSEAQRRDADASIGRQHAVPIEKRLGLRRGSEKRHFERIGFLVVL